MSSGQRKSALILAQTFAHAHRAAENWGWRSTTSQGWISHRNELVYYAADIMSIRDIVDIRMYIAYGWHKCQIGARFRAYPGWTNNRGFEFVTNIELHEIT